MSISLKFPDGAERSYDDGVTPLAVAEGISKSLAKKVVAAKLDGAWWDLTRPLEKGGKFELVTRDATTRPTCWRRRCRSCSPAPR
jgi:threonyl-tRNA synthetase